MSRTPVAVEHLRELGFSQYEARAYVGLLRMSEPATGYALSNSTGIPQPKVYETLRRLADKGVVVQVGSEPARFVGVAPRQVLSSLDQEFRQRLEDAEVDLSRLVVEDGAVEIMPVRRLADWDTIGARAHELIRSAERHVYLSGHSEQLTQLTGSVKHADERGVRFDVLHFGPPPFELERGRSLQHASTEGVIYRRHQARHLAAVGDSSLTLWALAPSGSDWSAMWQDDPLFAAVVKGYIRHDMYVQQIYADFQAELEEGYGPGLQRLASGAALLPDAAGERRGGHRGTRSA